MAKQLESITIKLSKNEVRLLSRALYVTKISNYKYEAIKKAYNMYVNKGYFWQGKGFNYFIKMVDTVEEDWLKYAEIQKKKFGTTPKIINWRNNAKSENSKINTKEKDINSRRSQRIN